MLSGSGSYHKDGGEIKIGKWVELDKGFRDKKQVIYIGEYNIKGRKLGRWNIMYCHFLDIAYKQIGGGFYDDGGSQIKVGKWIELDEGFRDKNQVTQNGEYNMKGVKIGTWVMRNIMQNEIHTEEKYDN